MEVTYKEGYEFIKTGCGKAEVYYSTAKGNLNFSVDGEEFQDNMSRLKQWFALEEVGYLRQTHSDLVYNYDGEVHEGDAVITNRVQVGIGVFTADCVPVLLYDMKNGVTAAVHSGWKSTQLGICMNVIDKMRKEYGSRPEDIVAFIGPHNKKCCYEFSEKLAKELFTDDIYRDVNIYEDNKLDIELCIKTQLKSMGILAKNIHSVDICSFCDERYEFYSYRKNKAAVERMFSFIVLRNN